MRNWFQVSATYLKMTGTGLMKSVKEAYLIEADNFAEAEARAVKELSAYTDNTLTISTVGKKKYDEVFLTNNGDFYYEAVLAFVTLDKKSGAEKITNERVLVQATDLPQAIEKITVEMERSMIDYRIKSVRETPVLEVFVLYGLEATNG